MRGKLSCKLVLLLMTSMMFAFDLSAQTVSLSLEQCGQAIPYGRPIVCTANDSAVEYEFKFFTSEDTTIITSPRNYILAETYYNILQADLAYKTIIRCRFGENWGADGDTCITKIVIDWFSEMLALYNTNEPISNRTDFNCTEDLNTEYIIPVVFHVIVPAGYDGENIVDYLPPDRINEQLDIINKFFAKQMAEGNDNAIDANMRFCFAKKDNVGRDIGVQYNGVTYYGITYRGPNSGINVLPSEVSYYSREDIEYDACDYYTLFPRERYLNIFVFENMLNPFYYGEAGSIRALNGRAHFSFIRLRHDVVGARDEMRSFGKDKGYTAVHELGHFFGLKHTFEEEDYQSLGLDYQPDPPINANCIETEPNVHNVMNYVNDECKRFFTRGQVCRMRETIATDLELSSLVGDGNTVLTDCAPVRPNIFSANIVSPLENIICQHRADIITITVDDIDLVKQISINDDPVDLEDDDVEIDEVANKIEIQYTFDALGYYDIEVSCGYDNISSNWRTIHRIIETVECEAPTTNLEQSQWYYDSYASLDFREGLARFNGNSEMDAVGSESSICDSNGNLLFYTDGRRIWNSQHELLVNSVLESQIKERSTIILKFSEYKYAIISISISENDGRLYGCVVDVTNGLNANATLSWTSLSFGNDLTNLSVLSAVPAREPNKYWLLTTKKIGDSYYRCVAKLAYDNNNGTMTILSTDIDSSVLCDTNVLSIKVSPDAQYVLYSIENNGIKFFRFYPNSGEMDFLDCNLFLEGAKRCAIEFSQSGKFLYIASIVNEISDKIVIAQCVMDQMQCACDIQQTEICRLEDLYDGNFLANVNLQRAPDGKIYIGRHSDIYSNSRMIGVILNPEVRDEDNGRSNMCGVRMHAIDYNENRYVNHINFPNLVDVKEIDTCKVDFFVCADWCPGNVPREINNIVNLSNTLHNTWRFYDENNVLIATSSSSYDINEGRPDSQDYSNINSYEFVTIELSSTECPSVVQTRTIGRRSDVYPQIVGQDSLCKDGQPHSYHVNVPELEPSMRVNWTSPYNEDNDDLHLIYNPNYVVDNHIPLVAEIRDNSTNYCPYIVSKQVGVTEITYVSSSTPYCNENHPGSIEFSINNYQGTNTLPPYNFSDIYGNEHSNGSTFTVGSLPIGEYSYNITNDYCNYDGTIDIESSLGDINISVVQNCEVDTIKLWKEDNTSLSGYVFTLNSGEYSYTKTTDESVLTLVVSQYYEYSHMVVYPQCSIDITGPEPDFCTLSRNIYIPTLPEVEIITHCNNDNSADAIIIIRDVEDINLLYFNLYFQYNNNATLQLDHIDVNGTVYYMISNITCNDLLNSNSLYIEYNECVIYKGPINECTINEIESTYMPICEIGEHTDIDLTIIYASGQMMPGYVAWTWNDGNSHRTTGFIQMSEDESVTQLTDVPAGTYHYAVHFGNCIHEGYIEIGEAEAPEYTIEIENGEVCINIISLPPETNRLVVRNAAGAIVIESEISVGQRYCFISDGGYHADIITMCDTFPVYFHVYNINVELESIACYKSDVDISFEISGGVAPYTATFTCGDYTTTQTFNTSGPNVMHAEIIQGVMCSLIVTSADGNRYVKDWESIDYISGLATLPNSETNQLDNTYNGGAYIVTSGLTFDHDVTFNGSTIYCTYEDNDDITSSQWTVNGGKTVTFENCTIKAACPDKMWQGINVKSAPLFIISNQFEGNMTKIGVIGVLIPITPIFNEARAYGKVIFRNGSLIEDALKAIESTEGGKIIASGSDFNNNQYDLYYNAHTEAQGNLTSPTISTCTFATTRLLNDNSIFPEAHIYLGGVRGIYVDNCTFGNNMPYSTSTLPEIGTPYYTDRRGIGISSVESNLQTVSTNTFNGLSYAVHLSGLGTVPVQVTNCVMSNVFRGIYINNNNGCIVQDNDITCQNSNLAFAPSNNPPSYLPSFALKYNTPYGAYLNSCTGFTFEHNTIKRAGTGLYVNNSGEDDNRVENNIFGTAFDGNTNGMVAIGKNSNFEYNGGLAHSGDVGLQALCNVFTGNSYDFGAYSGNMRIKQGTETEPAGNQFYKLSLIPTSHKQFTTQMVMIFTYGNSAYTYYEHDDGIEDGDINNYYRELKDGHYDNIVPDRRNIAYYQGYCDCEVPFEPIIFPRPHPIPFIMSSSGNSGIGEINLLNSELTAKIEELTSKIDNGNTDMALAKATAITSASNIIVDDFCTDGYISDTVSKVLKSKIEEKPVAITSVFIENSPLPTETYEEVMETDISSVLKYVLSYYQSGETKCAKDKKEIARISQEIGAKEKILYLSAMYDTTKTVQNEIADVFASQGSVAGKSKAFDILMSKDDFLGVADVITNIRSIGTDAASKYADIAERCIELTVNPDTAKIRLRGEREFLLQLIADNSYLYSGKAMSLYKFAFDTILPDYTPMFEDVIAPKSKSTEVPQLPNIFTVYPNPTTGLVTVIIDRDEINDEMIEFLEHYGMQDIEDCENVTVSILDINGRVLQTQEFNYEEEIILNIGSYVPGAYIVEIRSCFSDVYSTKIIKI